MRSQMAEGLARALAKPGTLEVRSGGTNPAGFVHRKAVRAMAARGIDISLQSSKPIDLGFAASADAVITLCGPLDAACPANITDHVVDWTMDDPSWGTDPEVEAARDALEARIVRLLGAWGILEQERVRVRP